MARSKKPTVALVPTAPPPFVIDPAALTGTCDTGDVLENVLDELEAVLAILTAQDWHDGDMHNVLHMAHRKAKAARSLYDNLDAWAGKERAL